MEEGGAGATYSIPTSDCLLRGVDGGVMEFHKVDG